MHVPNILKIYLKNYSNVPHVCWARIFLTFINDISGGIIFFLSLYFIKTLNFSIIDSSKIISFYAVGTALGGIIGGKLSDKYSPKIIAIVSQLIKAMSLVMLIKIHTLEIMILNAAIMGFTTYSFSNANNTWVLRYCGTDDNLKLKIIAILYVASNFGICTSALIVNLFADLGFKFIFIFLATTLLVSALYLMCENKKITFRNYAKTSLKNTPNLNKNIILPFVLTCVFIVGLIASQLSAVFSIYLVETFPQIGVKGVSIIFMLNSILVILLQTPVLNYLDKKNKYLLMGLGGFLYGFGMFILVFSSYSTIPLAAMMIYTLGEILFFANAQFLCYQQADDANKGQALGMYNSIYALSVIVGPTLGGYVYYNYSPSFVWYACGLLGVICSFISIIANQQKLLLTNANTASYERSV